MQISIQITGNRETREKLRKLGQSLVMLKGAMDDIGTEFVDYYSGTAFASEGGVYGERWKTLSPAYERSKAKRYPGKGILEASGKMKSSFRSKANQTSVIIDNTADHFEYHQSNEARNKLPRRKMMGLNTPLKNKIRDIIDLEIKHKLKVAGL